MTIVGDDIILNCRECFQEGFGMKLTRQTSGVYVCAHNPNHKYVIKDGFTTKPDSLLSTTYRL